MSTRFSTLSGFWTGVYAYPSATEPVAFNAVLTESAGEVSGESIEPNTFASASLAELFASLAGAREGDDVRFVKTYEDAPGAGHSLVYEGVVDETLTKIEGLWRSHPISPWTGSFVMNRKFEQEAVSVEEVAESDPDQG